MDILNRRFEAFPGMKIVFLGTGAGFPSKERGVTSIAVRLDREIVLFDCGEGTQRQLMASSLSYMKVGRIFISHFHGDHFLGLAGLVQSMCLNGRQTPLEVYGPDHTIRIVGTFLTLGHFNQTMPVICHELAGGELLSFPGYSVRTLEADHGIPALAFALEESPWRGRFDPAAARELGVSEGPDFRRLQNGEAIEVARKGKHHQVRPEMVMGPPRRGRKITYSGDTRPMEAMAEFARDSDVLIHEATFHSALEDQGMEFGHSTSRQAAELASRAGAARLFLTHLSNRYAKDPSPLLLEARDIFPATELALDLLEYVVPRPKE